VPIIKNFLSQTSFLLNLGLLDADIDCLRYSQSFYFILLTEYSTAGRFIYPFLALQSEVKVVPDRC